MDRIRVVEKPGSIQTSVRHSDWVGTLKNQARGLVGGISGKQLSSSEFMALATGTFATKILKASGMYDDIKRNYEAQYGPVQEYLEHVDETEGGEISDPMYDDEED